MQCSRCGEDRERYNGQAYCKVCSGEQQARWAKENRERKADINRAWRRRNAVRRKAMMMASNALWRAIRNGSLSRGTVCAFCESDQNIEAAHTDYGKPLEVLWLCRKCHRQWDAIAPKSR